MKVEELQLIQVIILMALSLPLGLWLVRNENNYSLRYPADFIGFGAHLGFAALVVSCPLLLVCFVLDLVVWKLLLAVIVWVAVTWLFRQRLKKFFDATLYE